MHHIFVALAGCAVPSTDLLVILFCFVCSCPFLSIHFFLLSDDVVSHVGPWEPAENATFLNTRETQREPQFLLGVAVHASAELRGPAWQ